MSPNHGTANRYNNYGCRCKSCKRAWSEYQKSRMPPCPKCGQPMAPRRGQKTCMACSPHFQKRHGLAGYRKRGCRCDVCRAAAAAQKRRQRGNNAEKYRIYWREYRRKRRAKVAA